MPQMPHLSMNIEGVPQYSSNVYWMWIFEQNCIHRSDMTFSAFRRFIGPCKISLPISQICRNGPFVNRQHGGNLRILVYPIPSSKLLHTAKSFEWSTCASKICCDSSPPRSVRPPNWVVLLFNRRNNALTTYTQRKSPNRSVEALCSYCPAV